MNVVRSTRFGNPLAQLVDQLDRLRPIDAALHPLQHRVVDVLQRHVEIGDDLRRAGDRARSVRR